MIFGFCRIKDSIRGHNPAKTQVQFYISQILECSICLIEKERLTVAYWCGKTVNYRIVAVRSVSGLIELDFNDTSVWRSKTQITRCWNISCKVIFESFIHSLNYGLIFKINWIIEFWSRSFRLSTSWLLRVLSWQCSGNVQEKFLWTCFLMQMIDFRFIFTSRDYTFKVNLFSTVLISRFFNDLCASFPKNDCC